MLRKSRKRLSGRWLAVPAAAAALTAGAVAATRARHRRSRLVRRA